MGCVKSVGERRWVCFGSKKKSNGTIYSNRTDNIDRQYHNMEFSFSLVTVGHGNKKGGKRKMIDEYKTYKVIETVCSKCGERIIHKANFIEHRCRCGNWINITAFTPVTENADDNEIAEEYEERWVSGLRRDGWTENQIRRIVKIDRERTRTEKRRAENE